MLSKRVGRFVPSRKRKRQAQDFVTVAVALASERVDFLFECGALLEDGFEILCRDTSGELTPFRSKRGPRSGNALR